MERFSKLLSVEDFSIFVGRAQWGGEWYIYKNCRVTIDVTPTTIQKRLSPIEF